jgi:hypothetical protein
MQGTQEFNEDDLKYQRSIRRKIIWRLVVYLGGGALVLFLAILFITNPGILSGPMEYLQSLSQGKSAPSPGQANALASPVAKKTFNTAEDYLDLITTDSSQLSKDQLELVQIFNEALNRLTMINKSETNAKATAGPIILQSVTTAQNKEDFDKIRAAVDSLKTAATKDLNSLQSFEKDLTVPLQGNGIKPPMDAQIASTLATRANVPDKIQKANNVIKFADASNAYCDFLEKNRGDWSFKGQGRAFKDRKILDEAITLGKQFTQSAVDAGFQFSVAEGSASSSPSATGTP